MTQANPTVVAKRRLTGLDIQEILLRGRAFIALIVLIVVFSLLNSTFLTPANIVIMAKHVAINAILGIGMTFVILTGGIDLSVGSLVGLAAMIATIDEFESTAAYDLVICYDVLQYLDRDAAPPT